MHVLSVRESLGGSWAGNFAGLAILFLPTSLLVILQEMTTNSSSLPLAIVLAVISHLAAGLVIIGSVQLLRLRWTSTGIPIPLMVLVWIAAGAARGLVWALWHLWVLGGEPEFLYRILVWVAISAIWSPLFTYTFAQLDHRRTLLSALTAARVRRATERARADQSSRERRAELVAIVQRTIGPVIRELHRSLHAVSGGLTESSTAAMGSRLSSVAYDAARLVAPDREPEVAVADLLPERAPLSAALDFQLERPVYAAFLAGVALTPLVLPDALRFYGPAFGLSLAIAILTIVVGLAVVLAALRRVRLRRGRVSWPTTLLVILIPGLVGSAVLISIPEGIPVATFIPLALILPIGGLFCGANVAAAVGLASSNEDLAARVETVERETQTLTLLSEEADQRAREQLAELLHGPVYGRLSACTMALNFHAEALAKGDTSRSDYITGQVLEYLSAASRDLDALASI